MIHVIAKDGTLCTAVAEIDGRLIDGNTGWDVTNGQILGRFLKAIYAHGRRFAYYIQGKDVYQLAPGADTLQWFCDLSVVDTLLP